MKITWGVSLTVLFAIVGISEGRKGFGPGEQEFGYVDVRPGAHMFYWLYYTTAHINYTERPLVMWLQGGPGVSSTSYGNFEEIGPLTVDLKPRDSTWAKYVNLLFVDNPVGTGFSYVDNKTLFSTTNQQIGTDLVELMRGFLKENPLFQTVPFYIFSQSYGGKMAVEFALQLEKEMKANKIKLNLKGIALGDPRISPVDSVLSWAPYLYNTGIIDRHGFEEVDGFAKKTQKAVEMGDYNRASQMWGLAQQSIVRIAANVDFHNILTPVLSKLEKERPGRPDESIKADEILQDLMDGPLRLALGIPDKVRHGWQRGHVFTKLTEDFMKPVTNVVEELLNTTSLEVVVYTGQLDLFVDTPGTVQWVNQLKWPSALMWTTSNRETFEVSGNVEGFVQKFDKLSLYWINRAGRMAPADNPAATIALLRIITSQ